VVPSVVLSKQKVADDDAKADEHLLEEKIPSASAFPHPIFGVGTK
jgi:hypothetical protein